MKWRDHAACLESDLHPDAWFATGDTFEGNLQLAAARRVCVRCDVAAQCYAYAIDEGIEDGMWGGHLLRRNQQERNVA